MKYNNTNPLIYAIEKGSSSKIIQYLIEGGADVNTKDINGNMPLICAINNNLSFEIVEEMVDRNARINIQANMGKSVLMYAIEKSVSVDVIDKLINKGAYINAMDVNKKTPLIYAIEHGVSIGIIYHLIQRRADLNGARGPFKTPLMYALEKRANLEIIEKLITIENINKCDQNFKIPLVYAIEYGNPIEVIKLLVKRNANIELAITNSLIKHLFTKDIDTLELLIDYRIEKDIIHHTRRTAIEYAVEQGASVDRIIQLMKNGASLEDVDYRKKTALHSLLDSDLPPEMVTTLVQAEQDINRLERQTGRNFRPRPYRVLNEQKILLMLQNASEYRRQEIEQQRN